MSYMGDRRSSKASEGHVVKLGINGLKHKRLRDEMFLQIIKQINGHSSGSSILQGWKLMAIILGLFPPSNTLLNCFRAYLQKQEANCNVEDAKPYMTYCRETLEQVVYFGERHFPPDIDEIATVEILKHKGFEVVLLDDRSFIVKIGAQTAGGDAAKIILEKTNYTGIPMHAGQPCVGFVQVAKIGGKPVEMSSLGDTTSLRDVVGRWSKAKSAFDAHKRRKQGDMEIECTLMGRFFFYYLLKEGVLSGDGLKLYFHQGRMDVKNGWVTVPDKDDACKLAALCMTIDKGATFDTADVTKSLGEILAPEAQREMEKANENSAEKIMQAAPEYKDWTTEQCKAHFIGILLKQPFYGVAIYKTVLIVDAKFGDWDFDEGRLKNRVHNSNRLNGNLQWNLGVSERGILFIDGDNKIMKLDPLNEVANYGSDAHFFWYKTGDPFIDPTADNCARIMVFETPQGRTIGEFFAAYQSLPHNRCKYH